MMMMKKKLLTDAMIDRDAFCEQLPAATTTKKFDLRRKI